MSAEVLRRAAALMRERAEADGSRGWRVEDGNEGTIYNPLWMVANDAFHNPPANDDEPWLAVEIHTGTEATAEHIASWRPAVALAVADWLVDTATRHAEGEPLELVLHYDADEECEVCEDGGHEVPVCEGCFPTWEGMDGHSVYPCRETKAALAVARAYLGDES